MADTNQKVTKAIVVVPGGNLPEGVANQKVERFSLYGPDGTAISFDALVVQDGSTIDLTGYSVGVDGPPGTALADTDSLNEALGKLEYTVTEPGDNLLLTGYSLGVDVSALAATDTINEALSKLEARIVVLEP